CEADDRDQKSRGCERGSNRIARERRAGGGAGMLKPPLVSCAALVRASTTSLGSWLNTLWPFSSITASRERSCRMRFNDLSLPAGLERSRLCRRPERHDRVSLGGRSICAAAGAGG